MYLQAALDDVVAIKVADKAHDARLQRFDHDCYLRNGRFRVQQP